MRARWLRFGLMPGQIATTGPLPDPFHSLGAN